MKLGKRITALALGTALALSAAACGGGTASRQDAAEKIRAAAALVDEVESMEATMFMEMDMSAMGQSVESDTTATMSVFNDPMKLKMDMTTSMGQLGAVSMSVYAQAEGSQYTTYLYDGSDWITETVDLGELQQYDAQQSMELYLNSGADYVSQGTETINGVTADKYTGIIRGDALEEVIKNSGASSNLESSLGGLSLGDLYSDLGDMPITVWIDPTTGYPVRYYMDMSDVMESMMAKLLSGMGIEGDGLISISKLEITMDCYNYNAAADFTIPDVPAESADA